MVKRNTPQLYERCDRRPLQQYPRDRFFAAHVVDGRDLQATTKEIALTLGEQGLARTPSSLHITVSNGAMRGKLYDIGYQKGDVKSFADRLGSMLHKRFGSTALQRVCIDKNDPYIWVGEGGRKLALRLNDDRLCEQRQAIDEFFLQQTGVELPSHFHPHVSLTRALSGELRERTRVIAADRVPRSIATRGIGIYFGSVHKINYVWGIKKIV